MFLQDFEATDANPLMGEWSKLPAVEGRNSHIPVKVWRDRRLHVQTANNLLQTLAAGLRSSNSSKKKHIGASSVAVAPCSSIA